MTSAILKKIPVLSDFVDERFLNHRLRAQRAAGLSAFLVADALFIYRLLSRHVWEWDLVVVLLTAVVVKLGCMVWYRITE